MRASEILRKMADLIDAKETGGKGTSINNRPASSDVESPTSANTADIESNAAVNTKSMVGPLQQKLELLKKAAGISGAYDSGALSTDASSDEQDVCPECNAAPCECGGQDELDIIKQNAGIAPATVVAISDDEPTEG